MKYLKVNDFAQQAAMGQVVGYLNCILMQGQLGRALTEEEIKKYRDDAQDKLNASIIDLYNMLDAKSSTSNNSD